MSAVSLVKKHIQDFRKHLKLTPPEKLTVSRLAPTETVMIVSPHPDDEVLMGALALRLQLENKFKVLNVAVTLGSSRTRQAERARELAEATRLLKWSNVVLPEDWVKKPKQLEQLITKHKPTLIIAPHAQDRHPTHIKTHELVAGCTKDFSGTIAWAEYWSPQETPNLLVEVDEKIILKLVRALECHRGEIARNPYHLRLLGWQMDNVRRASEWLSGSGAPSAPMLAGQLYRLERKSAEKKFPAFATMGHDLTDWLT